jgi:BirA family biotin operon repressor/biotin-[acetyl-CoA-carboxylase] ligase
VPETFAQFEGAWSARARAAGLTLGVPATFAVETASTNDDAKIAAANGAEHGSLFVAGRQLAGRGRQGRRWECDENASLLFSVIVRVPAVARYVGALPVAAGLALVEAIGALAPATRVALKWPNDVRVGGRKVAGILAEATVRAGVVEFVVVGVGVNVGKMHFAPEFASRATSLENEGIELDRADVLEAFLARFGGLADRVAVHGLRDVSTRIAACHELFGRDVTRSDNVVAVADCIDDEGRLVVRRDDVIERWSSGEVHLVSDGGVS